MGFKYMLGLKITKGEILFDLLIPVIKYNGQLLSTSWTPTGKFLDT
jgi:hypothetical protein